MNALCAVCTQLCSAELFRTYRINQGSSNETEYAFKSPPSLKPFHERPVGFHSRSTAQILQRVFRTHTDITASLFVHKNLNQILSSLKTCHLCALIYAYVVTIRRGALGGSPSFPTDQYDQLHVIPFYVIRNAAVGEEDQYRALCFIVSDEPSATADEHQYAGPFATLWHLELRTLLARSIPPANAAQDDADRDMSVVATTPVTQRIRSWLTGCRRRHAKCANWRQDDVKSPPKRLLEVSRGLDVDVPKVKLIETADEAKRTGASFEWVALSHCWGEKVALVLNHARYPDWLKNLPTESLPKTFREAVIMTLRLGYRYLWIDALCIFQDEIEDFLEQAPLMRCIYMGSVFTIAATGSVDGEGGLFVQDHLLNPCALDFRCQGEVTLSGSYMVGPSVSSLYFYYLSEAKLNSRGWVCQERFLSPRTIHFAGNEVWWNCLEHFNKETHDPTDFIGNELNSNEILKDIAAGAGYSDGSDCAWEQLVERYSNLGFTKVEDRFIALAGIAQFLSKRDSRPPTDYVAGLWRPDVKGHLLWGSDSRERLPGRMLSSVAPSWAWPSYSGPVMFWRATSETNWHPHLKILDVNVRTWNDDPFASVIEGHIRLTGPILIIEGVGQWDVTVRAYSGKTHSLKGSAAGSIAYTEWFEGWDIDDGDGKSRAQSDATHLLPMCFDRNPEVLRRKAWFHKVTESDQCFAVMLLKAVKEEKGTYIKVGMRGFVWQHVPLWWSRGSQLNESQYLNSCGDGVYEIKLI